MRFSDQFSLFHDMAIAATGGLDDFGDANYHEPMKLILDDADRYSRLNSLGRQIFISEMAGMLVGRLRAFSGFSDFPEYQRNQLEKPLIIVGMARTGSTVLHRLLCEDPANQALPLWLANNPMPRPPRETWEENPAYQQVVQSFNQLYEIAPIIRDLHPMVPSENDECRFVYGQSFWNPGLTAMFFSPQYSEWCLNTAPEFAYRHFKKVLKLISAGSNKRWVLKDPCHMWVLPSLLKVFPDSQVVMTYRNPLKSLTSLTNMVYQLRCVTRDETSQKAMGKEFLHAWGSAMARVNESRKMLSTDQLFELHADDTRADPIGCMKRIYNHFDIPVTEQASYAWHERLRSKPNEGHGAHHYSSDDFGLEESELAGVAGGYCEHFREIEKNRFFPT